MASGGLWYSVCSRKTSLTSNSLADDMSIAVWSVATGRLMQSIDDSGQGPIVDLRWIYPSYAPREYFLISGGASGTIKLWKKTETSVSPET